MSFEVTHGWGNEFHWILDKVQELNFVTRSSGESMNSLGGRDIIVRRANKRFMDKRISRGKGLAKFVDWIFLKGRQRKSFLRNVSGLQSCCCPSFAKVRLEYSCWSPSGGSTSTSFSSSYLHQVLLLSLLNTHARDTDSFSVLRNVCLLLVFDSPSLTVLLDTRNLCNKQDN